MEIIILSLRVFSIAWTISFLSVPCYNSSTNQALCTIDRMKVHLMSVSVKYFTVVIPPSFQCIDGGRLDESQKWLFPWTAVQSPTSQWL